MDQAVIDKLVSLGFTLTNYQGQEGDFYVKKMKASEVPYLVKHVIDDDLLFSGDEVTYCVCPDGEVQLVYADQFEKAPMLSPEGRALLTDIGYPSYDLGDQP